MQIYTPSKPLLQDSRDLRKKTDKPKNKEENYKETENNEAEEDPPNEKVLACRSNLVFS
jgi:hypothetical protein